MAFNATMVPIDATLITPSDTQFIAPFFLYIGGAGNVTVLPKAQESSPNPTPVTYTSVPAGTYLFVQVCKVLQTGTNATNIIGHGPT